MSAYGVFLRGVNVGGINMKMADVRRVIEELPVREVRTLLASGNVVCAFDGPPASLKVQVETALRSAFGYQAWVVVLTAERLEALLDACPYPSDSKTEHAYITVTSDPAVLDEVSAAVSAAFPEADTTRLGPEASAWVAPVGGTLDAPWSTVANRSRYKTSLTDRNLRTMLKVRAALRAVEG